VDEHKEGREETTGGGDAWVLPVIVKAFHFFGEMVDLLQVAAEPAA
jgi:hypothetical protein